MFLSWTSPPSSNFRVDAAYDVLPDARCDADTAGFRQRFQTRGNVYAVTINIVTIDNDIAEIDPDAQRDSWMGGVVARSGGGALHRKRELDRINGAAKLDESAVANKLDDAAVVVLDLRIEDRQPVMLQRGKRACLILCHHPRIANDISDKDRTELAICLDVGHIASELAYGRVS